MQISTASASNAEELQAVAAKAMASAPPHVLGVTNLRGVIVPIVELRWRFGLAAAYNTDIATLGKRPQARMLLLPDIEELMTGSEMALFAQTLQ